MARRPLTQQEKDARKVAKANARQKIKDREWLIEAFANATIFNANIDFQTKWFGRDQLVANVQTANDLANAMRAGQLPIIWVLHLPDDDGPMRRTVANAPRETVVAGITMVDGDIVLIKNAGNYADLFEDQKAQQFKGVVLTGGQARACLNQVIMNSLGGKKSGLRAIVALDATDLTSTLTDARAAGTPEALQQAFQKMHDDIPDNWSQHHIFMSAEEITQCLAEGLRRRAARLAGPQQP
ncbi:MAG: isochorismatase family protein [Alphaproteobacteria bacterium]|nr:isochorismatase family protein [Alphaproteobacteria bacterium]